MIAPSCVPPWETKRNRNSTIKALLLHACDDGGHDRAEVGWGRIPSDVDAIALTDEHSVHIVYQGELRPANWVRMQIPIPADH
jgi:hypothetical protein